MTTATLFGIALAPLYAAIAKVESDRGATSANVYQIRNVYVDDVNRIIGSFVYSYSQIQSRGKSEGMMYVYWNHWGIRYQKKTGKPVTLEVLARIHNGGPIGWKKPETISYWNRVSAVLATQTEAEVDAWTNGGAQ